MVAKGANECSIGDSIEAHRIPLNSTGNNVLKGAKGSQRAKKGAKGLQRVQRGVHLGFTLKHVVFYCLPLEIVR